MIIRILFLLCLFGLAQQGTRAQIPRERVQPNGPVEEIFWSQQIISTSVADNLPKGNLNVTIMHVFGIATNGFSDLFGLDDPANIRFGFDYGISDRISVGAARSKFEKLFDFRSKIILLRQTKDNRVPVQLAAEVDVGIRTDESGLELIDRVSYLGSIHMARKLSENISLQLSPSVSHFNTVFIEEATDGGRIEEENTHIGLAIVGRFVLGRRTSFLIEYIPVFGIRSDRTKNELGLGFNLETGGHVFQIFVKTSPWLTQQHAFARNMDEFLRGDFRLGFNVNRVFRVGRR